MDEICEHCKFFEYANGEYEEFGFCRRYPPVMHQQLVSEYLEINKNEDVSVMDAIAGNCYFPMIDHDKWCGEFKAKHPSTTNASPSPLNGPTSPDHKPMVPTPWEGMEQAATTAEATT